MSRPAAMAEIHSAHAKPPAAIQKATMLPMPKTSQATNARAAGATKNPVVTTSIVDNPVLKQKMDFSTGRHQGAVHIPETIWPFGQKDSAALRMKRPMKKATYQAATQATGISIHLSAFMICCPTAAFSRSQPIDSQLRRTSSRFCCKALLAAPRLNSVACNDKMGAISPMPKESPMLQILTTPRVAGKAF